MTRAITRGWNCMMVGLLGLFMVGCAHHERRTVAMEETLAAAGFQRKPADTPEKLNHVRGLPQHKVIPVDRQGQVKYVWADAKDCKCLYVGTEPEYQEFARLALQEKIAREYYEAAKWNESAAYDWGAWDPAWGPPWWWW